MRPLLCGRGAVRGALLLLLLLLLGAAPHSAGAAPQKRGPPLTYNTSARRVPGKLNVFLVPHSHDDSGWLKTFDQYFYGSRQDIQVAGVQHVLSTVVQALKENPDRRFSYAEMSFFSAWWRRQPPAVQDDVRRLVAEGRLDFVNGGFVQHDEAAAHYAAMIDQTTRGHRFLNDTFGFAPRVSWQIDPFGHSATHAALMCAAGGLQALFFGRADYEDMRIRAAKRQLELLWRPSLSWGEHAQVWTHNYPTGNYGPPPGFDYTFGGLDPPIVDDPASPEFNVPQRVDAFVAAARAWASVLPGSDSNSASSSDSSSNTSSSSSDVLMMMGSDFEYANAHATFINLDRLIHHVNADGRVHALYATPAAYAAARAAAPPAGGWGVKTDDFFPYADCPHCYWTGYFTSRPASKGYIRHATSYLAAARQLQALAGAEQLQAQAHAPARQAAGSSVNSSGSLEALEFAVSLTQHHDAITGTEKQHVANDYARYLFLGLQQATGVVNAALEQLLTTSDPPAPSSSVGNGPLPPGPPAARRLLARLAGSLLGGLQAALQPRWGGTDAASGSAMRPERGQAAAPRPRLQVQQCGLLNCSICAASVAASAAAAAQPGSASLLLIVHNPLGTVRQEFVRVPVAALPGNGGLGWAVQDADGTPLPSQLLPVTEPTQQLQRALALAGLSGESWSAATHELVFQASLPQLGFSTFAIQALPSQQRGSAGGSAPLLAAASTARRLAPPAQQQQQQAQQPQAQQELSNGVLNLTLDASSGRFVGVGAVDGSWRLGLTQEFLWYKSSTGAEDSSDSTSSSASNGNSGSQQGTCDSSRGVRAHTRAGARNGGQASGAYIFRPSADAPTAQPLQPPGAPVRVSVVSGPLLTEVTQVWAPWASLTTRLWAGATSLEQEWTVGPIPAADGIGREVVLRTSTGIVSGGALFTDANGREMLLRRRDARPSWPLTVTERVAGNYYPITSAAAITDGCMSLGLATDRAQGAASLQDGQLEVMLHRVTVVDDARGVGEPLNETLCGCAGQGCECATGGLPARGTHVLLPGPADGAAGALRLAQHALNDRPLLAFAELAAPVADVRAGSGGALHPGAGRSPLQQQPAVRGVIEAAGLRGRWSGLTGGGFPPNLHVLTLMRAREAEPHRLILRLEHMFQAGEDAGLAGAVSIDLSQLLAASVNSFEELSLTAAQPKARVPQPRAWPAQAADLGGRPLAANASARAAWGDAGLVALRRASGCAPPSAAAAAWRGGWQGRRRLRQAPWAGPARPPFDIWRHAAEQLPVVELVPMEVRTFEVVLRTT